MESVKIAGNEQKIALPEVGVVEHERRRRTCCKHLLMQQNTAAWCIYAHRLRLAGGLCDTRTYTCTFGVAKGTNDAKPSICTDDELLVVLNTQRVSTG